jgi:hypothetical protein
MMQNSMKDITGITVSHNTASLIRTAYESIRTFHPDMPIIIIDGSDTGDESQTYVRSLASLLTTVVITGRNIGHGLGMDMAIRMVKTKFALIFDSDIRMIKSPVEQMLALMEPDTYGIGYLEKTGYDGFEYGAQPHHKSQGFMMMLHPYFHLLQVSEYFKFHPYVHHGAPCFLAALDIHRKGLTSKIIKEFPGLGHSSGKGWCWTGEPREYIEHHTAGTRKDRSSKGQSEIEGEWTRENSNPGPRKLFNRV